MMTLFLLLALEDQTRVTFYAIRATQEDRAFSDAGLRDIEADLKEMTPYNRFEIVGSAQVKHGQNGDRVIVALPIKDAGRHAIQYVPGQAMNGIVALKGMSVIEYTTTETVTLTGTGLSQKTTGRMGETIFTTTVDVAEGKLTLIGTVIVETKSGPATVVIAVKASASP